MTGLHPERSYELRWTTTSSDSEEVLRYDANISSVMLKIKFRGISCSKSILEDIEDRTGSIESCRLGSERNEEKGPMALVTR